MSLSNFIAIPLTAATGALIIATGWLGLYHFFPSIPLLIYHLLANHPWLTGVWLALAVIGIDSSSVALRDALSYGNVGQKARAHFDLSGVEDEM